MLADSFLCVADKATGFAFIDGEWISADFNVSSVKHIIRKLDEESIERNIKYTYGVFSFGGSELPNHKCPAPRALIGGFVCDRGVGLFTFNTDTGRYLKSYPSGFTFGDSVGGSPYIEIGHCSKI